jgi:hypothetical protein
MKFSFLFCLPSCIFALLAVTACSGPKKSIQHQGNAASDSTEKYLDSVRRHYAYVDSLSREDTKRWRMKEVLMANGQGLYEVLDSNGRRYLNSYWYYLFASKTGSFPLQSSFNGNEPYFKWPIEWVCRSAPESWDTIPPVSLGDGTFIYYDEQKKPFRGSPQYCIYFSENSLIATPRGNIPISEIRAGDSIYVKCREFDYFSIIKTASGKDSSVAKERSVSRVVAFTHGAVKQRSRDDQQMLEIILRDGRKIEAGPSHRDEFNKPFGDYNVGEKIDGSEIVSKKMIRYQGEFVYDIAVYDNLPGMCGEVYWVNGIPVTSRVVNGWFTDDLLRKGW